MRTALVVVPRSVNYFYNIAGERLAEALGNIGWDAHQTDLAGYDGRTADVTFLFSLFELLHSVPDQDFAAARIRSIRAHSGITLLWLLDAVGTDWFQRGYDLLRDFQVDLLADYSLHDQSPGLRPGQQEIYRWVFYGLTESEKRRVRQADWGDERHIPWVYVGNKTPERVALAKFLLEELGNDGFLYLSDVVPITETGPHLKDAAYQRVLERCRYHVWRSQFKVFYMEAERFRRAALAGCVPVKILEEDRPGDRPLPFPNLVIPKEELGRRLREASFPEWRRRFLEEYCSLPSLEQELARFLAGLQLPVRRAA
jgi:hypothetical protein